MKKAIVALARRLAVIMHRIWVDGTEFPLDQGTSRGSGMTTVQDQLRGHSSSTERWKMSLAGRYEVSSFVRLDLPFVRR